MWIETCNDSREWSFFRDPPCFIIDCQQIVVRASYYAPEFSNFCAMKTLENICFIFSCSMTDDFSQVFANHWLFCFFSRYAGTMERNDLPLPSVSGEPCAFYFVPMCRWCGARCFPWGTDRQLYQWPETRLDMAVCTFNPRQKGSKKFINPSYVPKKRRLLAILGWKMCLDELRKRIPYNICTLTVKIMQFY